MMNPLIELQQFGQSFWYDNMSRSLISSGRLARLVSEDGLRGLTSNPTIFEKAIGESNDYDEEIAELVAREFSLPDICEELMVTDIRNAADVLAAVYETSDGRDGFVSLEVNPKLAYETDETIVEAERLFAKLERPNVMIKIPATPDGIPAIEQAVAQGININITMLFARDRYEQVIDAYIKGLEEASARGKRLEKVASVASLFVSRVDTLVDKLLEENGADPALQGKAGIANAKLLYRKYKEVFHGERFRSLQTRGAQPQRLLWASTSTKNPKYRDVMYCEALIGAETVDTMPEATVKAFRDHGRVAATLETGIDEAEKHMESLQQAGIDYAAVMQKLADDGIAKFAESFDALQLALEEKQEELLARGRRA